MTKYSFKFTEPTYFKKLIQELPSFKTNIKVQTSEKVDTVSNDLDDFLNKIYQVEKNAMILVDKIDSQMKGLCSSLSELRATFIQLEKIKYVSKKHGFGYENDISSSYPKMAEFTKAIESSVAQQSKFFDSTLMRYMKYQQYEYKNFSEFAKRTKVIKDSLKTLQSSLSAQDKDLVEKVENIKVFRAFVNQLTHYNFKQLYITKNQRINQKSDEIFEEYIEFVAKVR